MREATEPALRHTIASVSAATGVGVHTLRAWERRYGVPRPHRSDSGYRLYGVEDVRAVQLMRRLIAQGATATQAAERARLLLVERRAGDPGFFVDGFLDRAADLDEDGARTMLDAAVTALGIARLLDEVLVPGMHELGRRWEHGAVGVDAEHLAAGVATAVVHRLAGRLRPAVGRRALICCAPGERHELPALGAGLRLALAGWQVTQLGADLPLASIARSARHHRPDLVGVSVTYDANADAAMAAAVAARAQAPADAVVMVGGQAAAGLTLPDRVAGEAALPAVLLATAGDF